MANESINMEVLDKEGLEYYTSKILQSLGNGGSVVAQKENILSNWYLANPFNLYVEKGNLKNRISKTSYTSTDGTLKMCVNDWHVQDGTVEVRSPNYLRLIANSNSGKLIQIVDCVARLKEVTLSTLLSDTSTCDDIKLSLVVNCINPITDNGWKSVEFSAQGTSGLLTCTADLSSIIEEGYVPCTYTVSIIANKSDSNVDLIATKLEVGNTSTLASKINGIWYMNDNPPTSAKFALVNIDNIG